MSLRQCLASLLMLALVVPPPAHAGQSSLPVGEQAGDQNISPFYRWTGPVPARPGRVLRSEDLQPELLPPNASRGVRLLYTSTDVRWNSGILPVSGALYFPRGPRPRGGWRLIVWAHGTLGMSDRCAPSWTGSNERDRRYIDRLLAEGFAVAAPDYQGLGGPGPHPYTDWRSEGRSVLDAARAALAHDRNIANNIVITGQSQGSGATLGAARLAAAYAPDLRVNGAIATALVTTFPRPAAPAAVDTVGGSPYYLVYRMLGGGLPEGQGPMERWLSPKGRILLDAARTRCDPRVVAMQNDINMDNAFTVPAPQVDTLLGPAGAMDRFRTRVPLMLGIGLADELIPAERQQGAARTMCTVGNRVVIKSYPGARHSETLTRSADDAVAFARAVMDGRVPASDCGTLPG